MSEWPTVVVVLGATIITASTLIALKGSLRSISEASSLAEKNQKNKQTKILDLKSGVSASIGEEEARKAEEDLRTLTIEREIVSYALTHLYEAQAEGKITENERDRLLKKYKDEMASLEKQINNKQMIVRLHELEATQADLIKLFHEKLDEITRNIELLRANLGLAPKPTKEKQEPQEQAKERKAKPEEKPVQKPQPPQRSRAEERIEAIQQEVLKILERLERQEAEG